MLDDLIAGRQLLRATILGQIKSKINCLIAELYCPDDENSSKTCQSAMLGSLYRVLASRGLDCWLREETEVIEDSVPDCASRLSTLLSSIREETIKGSGMGALNDEFGYYRQAHSECGPWMSDDERVRGSRRALLHPLVSHHLEHLAKQAEKSGADSQILDE